MKDYQYLQYQTYNITRTTVKYIFMVYPLDIEFDSTKNYMQHILKWRPQTLKTPPMDYTSNHRVVEENSSESLNLEYDYF